MRKRGSKIGMIFLFIIMAVALTANVTYADSDSSQPSNWAKAEIEKAKEINLLPERLQGEYRSNITREEFGEVAVSLYEALSGKEGVLQEENPFTDTQNTQVRIANELGIVKGVGDGRFAPDYAITRQEISVMLYRTLQAAKPEYSYTEKYEHIFADYDMISSWAKEAVCYLYVMEITNGVGDNRFSPKGNTSREEAIILAKRMYEKSIASKNSMIASRDGISRKESNATLKLAKLLAEEMGKPYKWGGTGPNGYDCSGLVYSIFGKLGISLPRTAREQATMGTYVSKDELQYGDLVLFARDGKNIHHVGIYVGDGVMVHSPQTGDVVRKTTIMSGYYERCYYTARRIIE